MSCNYEKSAARRATKLIVELDNRFFGLLELGIGEDHPAMRVAMENINANLQNALDSINRGFKVLHKVRHCEIDAEQNDE